MLITLLAASMLLLSACGPKEEAAPAAEPAVTVNDQAPGGTAPAAAYTSPLTGLPSESAVASRPMAVMINNAPAARPQSGLGEADIVYEVLAEGGITRLVGIFQSSSSGVKIGPVRSIRPYLIDIGESYHGVLVHAGGSPDAYALIQQEHKEELDEIGKGGAYFWRDKTRKAPHNLYTNLEQLHEGTAKQGFAAEDNAVPSYSFKKEDDPAEGNVAKGVEVKFLLNSYKVSYRYNAETHLYERYIGDKPHQDKDTSQTLSFTNVVVLGADHAVLDDIGRLHVDLTLGGEALLLQRGRVIEGRWIRKADDVIRFVQNGQEVPFYPGKTIFNIVPNDPDFQSHVQLLDPL
ncbi:DUF3048 domain-containing protein [Paenibacillus sp. CAA11]|nr:DUF3048 domain-containing protein [Paenibacillus sp. CAA11]